MLGAERKPLVGKNDRWDFEAFKKNCVGIPEATIAKDWRTQLGNMVTSREIWDKFRPRLR